MVSTATHIQKRAQAFAHLDDAKLGWFHLRTILVAGVGFFTDSYDIFVISQSINMIYQVYYPDQITGGYYAIDATNSTGTGFERQKTNYTGQNYQINFNKLTWYNKHIDAIVKASTNWGNLIGQLAFGYLGDKVGRKRMYGIELIIMIVCTIASAMCAPAARGMGILPALAIWRFFLGIGIGGDYPMSAVITSEFANVRYRGMMLSAVFAMQGLGILIGGIVILTTLTYMQPYIQNDFLCLDYVWRIALGAGAIPGCIALYFRLTIPETPRFTVDVVGDTFKAESDVEKVLALNQVRDVTSNWGKEDISTTKVTVKQNTAADFRAYFGQWRHCKVILGAAYCWFALDIAWYGMSLNTSTILSLLNYNGPAKIKQPGNKTAVPGHDISDTFIQIAIGNIIIACAGTVPGYWFSVALIERMGRRTIQWMGFGILTVILAVLSGGWTTISTNQTAFMALFTIAQFFFQFGPNTTTFVVPGEVFPTRWRSTGHGICAAAGKAGAILGIQAVGPFFTDNAQTVLAVFSVVMFTGVAATFLIPETTGKTLEELSLEDNVIIEETHVEYVASDKDNISGFNFYPGNEMIGATVSPKVNKYHSISRKGSNFQMSISTRRPSTAALISTEDLRSPAAMSPPIGSPSSSVRAHPNLAFHDANSSVVGGNAVMQSPYNDNSSLVNGPAGSVVSMYNQPYNDHSSVISGMTSSVHSMQSPAVASSAASQNRASSIRRTRTGFRPPAQVFYVQHPEAQPSSSSSSS